MTNLHNGELITLEGLFATAKDNAETLEAAEQMETAKLKKKKEGYRKRRQKYVDGCTAEEIPDHLIPVTVST